MIHHYGLSLYLKTQWCKHQGLGEHVAGKLEAVLERAEIMWEKARVKRFHGADIPSDPGGKRLARGTKHLKVQCSVLSLGL